MWYSKIVEAGALDVLSGDIEIKESDAETLSVLRSLIWKYSSLPNFESIYKYFKSLLPKLISLLRFQLEKKVNPNNQNSYKMTAETEIFL